LFSTDPLAGTFIMRGRLGTLLVGILCFAAPVAFGLMGASSHAGEDRAAVAADLTRLADEAVGYQDYDRAASLYRRAVGLEDASAEASLGSLLLDERTGFQAPDEAVKLLRHAAKRGQIAAMLELAHCYRAGIGAPKDASVAQQWVLAARDAQGTATQVAALGR
jgi:TPR repeat protein